MTSPGPIPNGRYSHDLLLHDSDAELVAATRAFVELGLASGGQVLVHSSEDRVAMLREAVGSHPRLDYGLDCELYLSPSSTLFAYERKLAAETTEMWVTGTVPLGEDPAGHAAWTRYESLVNEVLGPYAFHAMCTYDTRTLPAETIAAARASHPGLSAGGDRSCSSAEYLDPAAFLATPSRGCPTPRAGHRRWSRPWTASRTCGSHGGSWLAPPSRPERCRARPSRASSPRRTRSSSTPCGTAGHPSSS